MLFGVIAGIGVFVSVGAFVSDTIIDRVLDSAGFYDRFDI